MSYQKCPVCEGRGLVPFGFYSLESVGRTDNPQPPHECRTCKGSGMVGFPDYVPLPFRDFIPDGPPQPFLPPGTSVPTTEPPFPYKVTCGATP